MRTSARLCTAALASTLALAACGSQPPGGTSAVPETPDTSEPSGTPGHDPTTSGPASGQASEAPATRIADDFPLSAGMGGPRDTIPTSRTGTGLRALELCGTSPLRGLGTRDRMVADNSGGEALHTRELVLLVTQMYGEWPDVAEGIDLTTDLLADVVDAMSAVERTGRT